MEFNEFKSHPKSKSKRWVSLSLVALVAIGGVVYYTWPREVAGEDTPPVLEMSTSALQGAFVDDKIKFLNYEDGDAQVFENFRNNAVNLSDVFDSPKDIEPGIHFYSFKSDRDFKFALDVIEPVVGNQMFWFIYSPGGEDDYGYSQKGFYVYPKGPFGGTFEMKYEELESKIIPAHRVFGVISKEKTVAYSYQTEKDPATEFPQPLGNTLSGWVQVVATNDIESNIAPYADRIELNKEEKIQLWYQNSENSFNRAMWLDDKKNWEGNFENHEIVVMEGFISAELRDEKVLDEQLSLENYEIIWLASLDRAVVMEKLALGKYKTIWLKMKEKESVSPAS